MCWKGDSTLAPRSQQGQEGVLVTDDKGIAHFARLQGVCGCVRLFLQV